MSHGTASSRPRTSRADVGPRFRRPLASVAPATVLGLLLPIMFGVPMSQASTPVSASMSAAAPAAIPVPTSRTFGVAIDAPADYQAQTLCTPAPKPGAKKLATLLVSTYGPYSVGIARDCSIGATSEHKEGRALDWMITSKIASQNAKAEAFLSWLLATDANGNEAAMARRLGVMYIGWKNQFWAGYEIGRGWTDLKGCTTDPAKKASSYDTFCHRNHVHISLTWDGAAALTSFWTGVALAPACRAGWGGGAPASEGGTDLIPVTPVRVLTSSSGLGLDAPCRLAASPSWSPGRGDLVVPVVGRGEVPADGVAAVAVRVSVVRGSAPLPTISVRSTDTSPYLPVTTALSTAAYSSTVVVPVARDGTIRLAIDRGAADVIADVVGWAPTPDPVPAPDPSAPAALVAASGTTHLVRATVVYDGTATPLAPGETRAINLAGVAGIPPSGLAGLAVSLTVDPTTTVDSIGVYGSTTRTSVGMLRTSTSAVRVTQLLVPTSTGVLTLRNMGASAAPVRLVLNAWFSDAATGGGRHLTLRTSPARVVDSTRAVGLAGPVLNGLSRLVTLTGSAYVPAGVRGVLLAVSAYGGSTDGILSIGSSGMIPVLSLTRGQWTYETVFVPLSSSGRVAVRTASLGTQVRMSVVGFVA